MKGWIALRKPVLTPAALDTSSTNVTSSAYVQLVASTTNTASGAQFHNSGAQPLKVAVGAAGSEKDIGVVIPIGVSILIPVEIPSGSRVSLKSMGGTQSSGIVTATFFQ